MEILNSYCYLIDLVILIAGPAIADSIFDRNNILRGEISFVKFGMGSCVSCPKVIISTVNILGVLMKLLIVLFYYLLRIKKNRQNLWWIKSQVFFKLLDILDLLILGLIQEFPIIILSYNCNCCFLSFNFLRAILDFFYV